jgi:HD-GYP domain-containing protein (c-di-GMP phosphodiesterase class II)
VAVSLDSRRPLEESDLRIIRVVWRLQVDHDRHVTVYKNLKETLFGIVQCLSTAIDAKDPYTCGHSERVARIAVRLGEVMGLSRGETCDLYLSGLLHDVGKIGNRDEVLFKPGPLTREEEQQIREHPVIGERIISSVTMNPAHRAVGTPYANVIRTVSGRQRKRTGGVIVPTPRVTNTYGRRGM